MNPTQPRGLARRNIFLLTALLLGQSCAFGQGIFTFWNPNAPTYIGVLGGPFAGSGIEGQALVGLTQGSLTPMGVPTEHQSNGLVPRQFIGLPSVAPFTDVQVQMAVWDGTLWGTDITRVPANQLGFTDIVPVELVPASFPSYFSPQFMQSAVVPGIPEPAAVSLVGLGAVLWLRLRVPRRPPAHSRRVGGRAEVHQAWSGQLSR
jgi:hypothetical protein